MKTQHTQNSKTREIKAIRLFDSHCHLNDRSYRKDMDTVVNSAINAGVMALMIVGADENSSRSAVRLAETREHLYASVGIHPHNAKTGTEAVLTVLRQLCENPKVKAWGEIGLDFNRMYSPRKDQEKWFQKQLEVADELNLPVILHERDSNGRLLTMLKTHPCQGRKGVVHCFSGNKAELEQYLDLGFHIGITGILTLKSRGSALRKLVPFIPTDRILVETDAPYLTPSPQKNHTRRNEPAFVTSVLFKLAEIRGEDPAELSNVVWENTCRLYNITG